MIFWLKLIDGKRMPNKIKIFEVGPRDGLQNTPFNVSVENKWQLNELRLDESDLEDIFLNLINEKKEEELKS